MKSRVYYYNLLEENVKNPKMIAHSLVSEAVMRSLARKWGVSINEFAELALEALSEVEGSLQITSR